MSLFTQSLQRISVLPILEAKALAVALKILSALSHPLLIAHISPLTHFAPTTTQVSSLFLKPLGTSPPPPSPGAWLPIPFIWNMLFPNICILRLWKEQNLRFQDAGQFCNITNVTYTHHISCICIHIHTISICLSIHLSICLSHLAGSDSASLEGTSGCLCFKISLFWKSHVQMTLVKLQREQ